MIPQTSLYHHYWSHKRDSTSGVEISIQAFNGTNNVIHLHSHCQKIQFFKIRPFPWQRQNHVTKNIFLTSNYFCWTLLSMVAMTNLTEKVIISRFSEILTICLRSQYTVRGLTI